MTDAASALYVAKLTAEIEALRAENARLRDQLDYFGNLAREHKDELETEIARLREALKPFSDVPLDGYEYSSALLKTSDLRAARAALGETE